LTVARADRNPWRTIVSSNPLPVLPEVPEKTEGEGISSLALSALWLDDQPRRIVPDATLARLIAEGQAHPAELLAELKTIAKEHPYYRGVLQALEELARTIQSDGVLEPLLVVKVQSEEGDRFVLRDGHRRSLGSLIAGKDTAPVRLIDEASALQSTARSLVVNIQRQDLTALEKGRWLYKLARLVEDQIREEQGVPAGRSVIEELVRSSEKDVLHVQNVSAGGSDNDSDNDKDALLVREDVLHVQNVSLDTMARRALAAAVRKRVLELTGLGEKYYYNLIYLNRLTPEAQEAGLAMTEGQLRPVTSLPGSEQESIVRFIAERHLTSKEAATLVGVAKSGDRDAVRKVMQKLAKEDVAPARTAVSWEPLLHAIPQDLWVRLSSLKAELAALPAERRDVRLRSLEEQERLAREFGLQIREILALYAREANEVTSEAVPDVREV
jgi:ParB/RepB/Spo0J family partition protein